MNDRDIAHNHVYRLIFFNYSLGLSVELSLILWSGLPVLPPVFLR